jgi:hypothetical protein
MVWSKLRSHLREFTAPSVRKRIDFHLVNYRKLSELANEFIVTIDGEKVFSASTSRHNIAAYIKTRRTGLIATGDGPEPYEVEKNLTEREVHARKILRRAFALILTSTRNLHSPQAIQLSERSR